MSIPSQVPQRTTRKQAGMHREERNRKYLHALLRFIFITGLVCKVAKIPIHIRIGEGGRKDSTLGMIQLKSVIKNYNYELIYIGGGDKKKIKQRTSV